MQTEYKSLFDLMLLEPKEYNFLDISLDFTLDPDHFMEWLNVENEEEIIGDYCFDCTNMCEYSCLYASMMLYNANLKGALRVCAGSFQNWVHFWLIYEVDDKKYFIDLTLKQFIPTAPKLSIIEMENEYEGYHFYDDGTPLPTIQEYAKAVKAFEFYTNPHTMKPSNKKIDLGFFSDSSNKYLNMFDEKVEL